MKGREEEGVVRVGRRKTKPKICSRISIGRSAWQEEERGEKGNTSESQLDGSLSSLSSTKD